MKGIIFKIVVLMLTIAFFGFVLYATGIPAVRWLDMPTAMGLIIGTSLITALGYRKEAGFKRLEKLMTVSLAITSVSFLVIGIMGSFVYADDIPDLMVLFGIAFLTVPYALVLYGMIKVVFRYLQRKKGVPPSSDTQERIDEHDARIVQGMLNIDPAWQLTPRETEIVEQLCLGLTNKEIGEKLFISETTVKRHLANVFSKTGIGNRQALIVHLHQRV